MVFEKILTLLPTLFFIFGSTAFAQIQTKMTISEILKTINSAANGAEKIEIIDQHLGLFLRGSHKKISPSDADTLAEMRSEQCAKAPDACLNTSQWYLSFCNAENPSQKLTLGLWKGVFAQATGLKIKNIQKTIESCPGNSSSALIRILRLVPAAAGAPKTVTSALLETIRSNWNFPDTKPVPAFEALNNSLNAIEQLQPSPVEMKTKLILLSKDWLTEPCLQVLLKDTAGIGALRVWIGRMANHLPSVGLSETIVSFVDQRPSLEKFPDGSMARSLAEGRCQYWAIRKKQDLCLETLKKAATLNFPDEVTPIEFEIALAERSRGNLEEALNIANSAFASSQAKGRTIALPWIRLLQAMLEKDLLHFDKAVVNLKDHRALLAKGQISLPEVFTLYGSALEQDILLSQGKFAEALNAGLALDKRLAALFDGPLDVKAWSDLHKLISVIHAKDVNEAKRLHKRILESVGQLPSFIFLRNYADAAMDVLEGRKPDANLNQAKAILGEKHPDISRIGRLLTLIGAPAGATAVVPTNATPTAPKPATNTQKK